MKRVSASVVSYSLLSVVILFAVSGSRASAQTKPDSASATQAVAVPARITQAIDETQLVRLKGSVHPMARPEFDQGPVNDSMSVTRALLLLQRSASQEAVLRQLLDDQQTQASPNFHKWFTPQQFGAQFGAADSDIQSVTQWLAFHGFQNIKVGPGRTVIEFSGNVAQIRDAFHTEIHNFLVNGQAHKANINDPQIPAALAPVVAGVIGLHDFHPKSLMHRAENFHPEKGSVTGKLPSVTFTGCGMGGGQCYGVAPADFAKIYHVPATVGGNPPGTGVAIAIVQDSNINISDIQQYRQIFGLSNNFTASNIIFNGPDPGIQGPNSVSGDEGEADLDVEISGGVATGATVDLVVSENPQTLGAAGIDLSAAYIIDTNLAPIMSESFGTCETGTNVNAFFTALWEQAAAQGISVFVSAGDSGSDTCDQNTPNDFATTGLSISGIASSPFNVAVGGTDFQNGPSPSPFWASPGTATESAKSYIPESPWNSSCASTASAGNLGTCTATIISQDAASAIDVLGGGGGQSAITTNTKPAWQIGITPASDTLRDIPDVSLYSAVNTPNNAFYIMCEADSSLQGGSACSLTAGQPIKITAVGGTSAAAPAFAGIMAMVVQQQGGNTVGRQGNPNFVLYQLYKKNMSNAAAVCPSNAASVTTPTCIFYDVITGNNSVACQGGTLNCSNTSNAANQFGVLVDPAATGNPAFNAVSGYDKATGLGSVNVTNLLTNWTSATFNPTTTMITSAPTGTIAHGATANFTVKVTSTSAGTIGGNVSLIASPPNRPPVAIGVFDNTSTSTFAVSGGTATISTNLLPGGTNYPVVAQYSGDGTFGGGTSTPVNVTVGQEASATAVSLVGGATATTAPYGSPYLLRVDVVGTGGSASQQCSGGAVPCPTGSISLTDNGNNLNDFQNTQTGVATNTAALANDLGFLEDQLVQLPAGANNVVAKYSGDSSYTGSTSPALVVTISPAATSLASVTANPSSGVTTATPVTLTASIATQSSGAGPMGTVTFSAAGTTLGTANVVGVAASGLNTTSPIAASGTAILTHTFATANTYTVSATYSGDTNYAASGPTSATPLVVTTGTTGSFAVASTPVALNSTTGASVNSTITVTSSGGFNSPVTVTCPTTLPAGVTCTAPAAITPPANGTATGTLALSVTATSSTLTASNVRDDSTLEARAVSQTAERKGWWTLSAGTGFAALFLVLLPGGRKKYRAALGLGLVCILSFTLGCGGGYNAPPPPQLTPTTTQMTVSADKVQSGGVFTFNVTVTGGTPTGMVQLFEGSLALSTAGATANVSNGKATITSPPTLQVGTHSLSVHYLSDATTASSQSGLLNLTVTGNTTVAITTTPAATPAASPITVTIN